MVLDLELHAEFRDHGVIKICIIVSDNPFGDAVPTYKVMLNELSHNILGNRGEQSYLNPLDEIINSD